jgi:DNA primase
VTVAKSEYTTLEVAGREVRLSNPAKVYFPKPGWTKLDVVEYYLAVADAALVHVRERPGTMKRFVNGITEDPIWQKRVPRPRPSGSPRAGPPRSSSPTTPRTSRGR